MPTCRELSVPKVDIVEQFEEACERTGRPQAEVIREFMEEFVQKNRG